MRKIFLILCLVFFVIPGVLAGNVTRSFSSSSVNVNNEVIVSLTITVNSSDLVYAIQENLPSQAIVTDDGDGTLNNTNLRWIAYGNLANTTKVYKIKFSSAGTYTISGNYAFNSGNKTGISGASQISVSAPTTNGGNGGGGGGGGGSGGTLPITRICTENAIRECGSSNIGECKKGTQKCVNNSWTACIGSIEPVTEICNDNKDNNCDGNVDENCEVPAGGSDLFWIIILLIVPIGTVFVIIIIFIIIKYKKQKSLERIRSIKPSFSNVRNF